MLTGFTAAELDPKLADRYFRALSTSSPTDLGYLIDRSGLRTETPPKSFADLEQRNLFEDPALTTLADAIITTWYSGTLPAANGQLTVVTYDDALGWKSINWTVPNMTCHGTMGAWASPPVART